MHKYEKGINRVSAGQLYAIALALGIDVAFFFDDIEPDPIEPGQQDHQRQLVELTNNVQRIGSPEHRQAVCTVARALAERVRSAAGGTGLACTRCTYALAPPPV